jgi:hypothetical protein
MDRNVASPRDKLLLCMPPAWDQFLFSPALYVFRKSKFRATPFAYSRWGNGPVKAVPSWPNGPVKLVPRVLGRDGGNRFLKSR